MDGPRFSWWKAGVAGIFVGVFLLGSAIYVLGYTDSRPFCTTCHIMETAGVTQKMSVHSQLACNDCHLPHNALMKYPTKAYLGALDVFSNTFWNTPIPFVATKHTKDLVNENCKRCHVASNSNVASMLAKPYCVDCHRNVPHQRQMPISTRMVAYE